MTTGTRSRLAKLFCAALLLAGCDSQDAAERSTTGAEGGDKGLGDSAAGDWRLVNTPAGAMVVLAGATGVEMRLSCRREARELLVNVPSFRAVGSEERMTFGQGGTVETLVADPSGDEDLGGVSATGPVPDNLEGLVSGRLAANYGSQNSGPHPPLPSDMVRKFVNACGSDSGSDGKPAPAPPPQDTSACLVQDGRRVPDMKLHAVGTEPFWAASVKGRCVTYSHPENQEGTRVWTQFSGAAENGTWSGYLDNARFVMRTRTQPGCSDGLSDKRYPIAVSLTVRGEERRGCAEFR